MQEEVGSMFEVGAVAGEWSCTDGDGVVNLTFRPDEGYGVSKGSLVSGKLEGRWHETVREAMTMGSLVSRGGGALELKENVKLASPDAAARFFLGEDFRPDWIDTSGSIVLRSDLPATRGWSPSGFVDERRAS